MKICPDQRTQAIVDTVDNILAMKRDNINIDTSKEEGKIDSLIYELYGLTEEEIYIVENTVRN